MRKIDADFLKARLESTSDSILNAIEKAYRKTPTYRDQAITVYALMKSAFIKILDACPTVDEEEIEE